MDYVFLGKPLLPYWTLITGALIFIAVRDAAVRPIWKYLARFVTAGLLGIGAGPAISAYVGFDEGVVVALLVVFGVMILDQLSDPKLLRALLRAKLDADGEKP